MWIDTDTDFKNWCQQARRQRAVALDTEFVWTKTYYPALGLLQMAWDRGHAALVDVLALQDTTPLAELLADASVTKIFHEAASDVPILRRWCGSNVLPAAIFDTRIAAGFAGLTATLSLNKLLTALLGITLPKTETRTDWLQRPLTPAQLEYASGDVDYMPEIYQELLQRLTANGNLPWFQHEMNEYGNPRYYDDPDPKDSWKRISGNGRYEGRQLAIVVCLADWRETYAHQYNIARPRIISDEQLCACAEHAPASIHDLIHQTGMWSKNAEKYGDGILAAIQRGLALPAADIPIKPHFNMDAKVLKNRSDRLKRLIVKRSEARQIDPVLVAPRRDIDSFVIAADSKAYPFRHKLLEGWKRELLGDAVEMLARTNFSN